ncbi:DEAD/DEAH box helicase [Longilinea arvoryzae]|uniref:DEAD/DEAH box helicase n=1 Tax=Longilinea arvoryzae TaxID=360412 RepID=UPI0009465558|nr:DEAD/DEAH box helicase [Longilinea arvoryzae]
MSFDTFNFHPQIKAGILAAGYSTPTPIQEQSIPVLLSGRDLLGLAQTGTGKTAAFALPILQRLMSGARHKPRALIVAPTRELAEQTHLFFKALGKQTGLRSLTLYGGVSAQPQIKGLQAGVEILVACPGRLLDLMSQRYVDLGAIETVVLDEADQMFDMGFLPAIRRILAALPARHQTLLFSATMPPEIRKLAMETMHDPATVEINVSRPVDTVQHAVYSVEQEHKVDLLLELLPQAKGEKVLIFTRTKHRAKRLSIQLSKAGLAATSLQGNLSQSARQSAMDGFRSGRVKVMVATDIAARGIDVTHISHVINFDMPDTPEAYTHRIGRTGRMYNVGTALSLVTPDDLPMLRTIEKNIGRRIERRQLAGFDAQPQSSDRPASFDSREPRPSASPRRQPAAQQRRPAAESTRRS